MGEAHLHFVTRQVSGGGGAVAVHVMPRYVLHNLLDVPLQCKQAGTAVERELAPGVRSQSRGHSTYVIHLQKF
jgi:hypothetical protein